MRKLPSLTKTLPLPSTATPGGSKVGLPHAVTNAPQGEVVGIVVEVAVRMVVVVVVVV